MLLSLPSQWLNVTGTFNLVATDWNENCRTEGKKIRALKKKQQEKNSLLYISAKWKRLELVSQVKIISVRQYGPKSRCQNLGKKTFIYRKPPLKKVRFIRKAISNQTCLIRQTFGRITQIRLWVLIPDNKINSLKANITP